MPIARRSVLRLSLFAMILASLAQAPAAHASCAPSEPLDRVIAGSDVVLVGTVTQLANNDRWAKVQVEEIWKGAPLPAVVEVHGGGPDPNTFSSVDRTYELGRYLFTLGRNGTELSDNACSGTTVWSQDLEAFRPADWLGPDQSTEPEPEAIDLGFLLPIAGVGIIALGIIGGAWLIGRARSA